MLKTNFGKKMFRNNQLTPSCWKLLLFHIDLVYKFSTSKNSCFFLVLVLILFCRLYFSTLNLTTVGIIKFFFFKYRKVKGTM